MEKKLRIKLYGESYKIHKTKIDSKMLPMFEDAAHKLKEPLHSAILNIDFFRVLNINKYKVLDDIIEYTFSGLINNYRNQVEISLGRKRIAKFNIDELFRPYTLFPLYNTQVDIFDRDNLSTGMYIEEKEIGLIGTYEIIIENLKMDLLKFYLSRISFSNENYELLNVIRYDGRILPLIKSDSLLRWQYCFLIE